MKHQGVPGFFLLIIAAIVGFFVFRLVKKWSETMSGSSLKATIAAITAATYAFFALVLLSDSFLFGYGHRIDITVSFWLQTAMYVTLGPLLIWRVGRFCRLYASPFFAYGIGFAVAGGFLFLASILILEQTSSGGRGWGGLIFLFLFLADAALAGIGGLLILIGIIRWLLRPAVEKSGSDAAASEEEVGKHENRWKRKYAASDNHCEASGRSSEVENAAPEEERPQ